MVPAVVNWANNTRKSSPAKATWALGSTVPGNGVYHAPPVASSTVMLFPGPPTNSAEASFAPHTVEGCCAAGVVASSAPMVRKLSNARSGKNVKNTGLMP